MKEKLIEIILYITLPIAILLIMYDEHGWPLTIATIVFIIVFITATITMGVDVFAHAQI